MRRQPGSGRRIAWPVFGLLATFVFGGTAWRFWRLRQGAERPGIFTSAAGKRRYLAAYDATLRLWPQPYQEMDLPTGYGRTHIIATGPAAAPPLLLLHGAGTSATIWYPTVAGLRQHYRLYAVDTMGDAGKSMPMTAPTSRHDYVQWLLEVLDGLGVGKTCVIGFSYGGWLAMNLALVAPERVGRIALLSPPAAFVPLGRVFWAMTLLSSLFPVPPVFRLAVWPYLVARGHRPHPRLARQLMAASKYCRLKLIAPTTFTDAELRRIDTPLLLVVGDEEALYLWRPAVQRARALLPDVRVEIVPGAAHGLILDQPEQVDQRILAFLAG